MTDELTDADRARIEQAINSPYPGAYAITLPDEAIYLVGWNAAIEAAAKSRETCRWHRTREECAAAIRALKREE